MFFYERNDRSDRVNQFLFPGRPKQIIEIQLEQTVVTKQHVKT